MNEKVVAPVPKAKGWHDSGKKELRKDSIKLEVGQKFGKWTVLEYTSFRKHNQVCWLCECECGEKRYISAYELKRGHSTRCRKCADKSYIAPYCINGHERARWGRTPTRACRGCLKDKSLRRNYGITLDDFIAMWEYQKGKCAICGRELQLGIGKEGWSDATRIEVDHLHGTKLPKRETVRGLLCGGRWAGCNRKLGRIDKPEWLKAALEYVSNSPAKAVLK